LRHGLPPITLQAESTGTRLRVSVTDVGARRPVLPAQPPSPDKPSGRGLLILDALAETWGVVADLTGRGKTVWFTLRTG
jgi:serine/threonine-protein kinase RsbW